MTIIVCKIFFCFLCFYEQLQLSKQPYFGWDLLYLSQIQPGRNLKVFRYWIWTSVKISVKKLSSKTKYSTFLQLSCSNFKLKLCKKPHSYHNSQKYQFWRDLGQVRSKKLFLETSVGKIYETNSSFLVK